MSTRLQSMPTDDGKALAKGPPTKVMAKHIQEEWASFETGSASSDFLEPVIIVISRIGFF